MMGSTRSGCVRPIWRLMSVSLFIVLATASARADDAGQSNQIRISAYAGVFIPQSVSWTGSGVLNGLPISATGKLSSNVGWATGGLIGYNFDEPGWRWLNIDLTAGYVTSTLDQFSGTVSLAGLGSISGPAPLSGSYHTYAAFVNFLATPFGIRQLLDNRVTPFVGIGPGVASTSTKLESFNLAGASIPVNAASSETDFAFDAVLGADYALAEHWELGIAYQYTWLNTKHLGGGSSFMANSGASQGHSVGLILEYRFGKTP
jgi:opacity protein-like surface antigen